MVSIAPLTFSTFVTLILENYVSEYKNEPNAAAAALSGAALIFNPENLRFSGPLFLDDSIMIFKSFNIASNNSVFVDAKIEKLSFYYLCLEKHQFDHGLCGRYLSLMMHPSNMPAAFMRLEIFHELISLLNGLFSNIQYILVTLETSHLPISLLNLLS